MKNKIYGYQMAKISGVYLSVISSKMSSYGFERGFFAFLYLCENSGEVSQKDLADAMSKDKVTTMRIVDYFSEIGLVERKQHKTDRRVQLLEVTKKGFELREKVEVAIQETNDVFFEDFSAEERKNFENGMGKLMVRIDQLPEPDYFIEAFKKKK